MNIDSEIMEKIFEENIENIASVVHDIWAHWQAYLHSQCEKLPDGSLKIPKELVEQWEQQINLKYEQLTRSEKDSDIEQAYKYESIFFKILNNIVEKKDT